MKETQTIYHSKRKSEGNIKINVSIWRPASLRRINACFGVLQRENPGCTKGRMQEGKPELHKSIHFYQFRTEDNFVKEDYLFLQKSTWSEETNSKSYFPHKQSPHLDNSWKTESVKHIFVNQLYFNIEIFFK